MAHPYHHALSSVKKWGGEVSDYLPLHSWFDQSKAIEADFRHRALRHHAEGIFMLVTWTGKPAFMFASTEVVVPVVHRRGPAGRVARIDAQAERTAGRLPVDPPGRAPGRVPYLLQPRFAYGKSSTAASYGSASVWISAVGGFGSFLFARPVRSTLRKRSSTA
jgi:hypothetical protein